LFGGNVISDPDVSQNVYYKGFTLTATGTDNQVYVNGYNGVSFSGWYSLGGAANSGPSIAFDGRALHVIARGFDNAAWVRDTADGGVWNAWRSLGGAFVSDPDILALDTEYWVGSPTGNHFYKQAWGKGTNLAFFSNTWGNAAGTGADIWGGWALRFTPS
jgi:hypothetical protein